MSAAAALPAQGRRWTRENDPARLGPAAPYTIYDYTVRVILYCTTLYYIILYYVMLCYVILYYNRVVGRGSALARRCGSRSRSDVLRAFRGAPPTPFLPQSSCFGADLRGSAPGPSAQRAAASHRTATSKCPARSPLAASSLLATRVSPKGLSAAQPPKAAPKSQIIKVRILEIWVSDPSRFSFVRYV